MKQGVQEKFENNEKILKYGCYFLCLVELGNRINKAAGENGFEEREEEVMYDVSNQYAFFVKNGAMKSDCTILDPAYILGNLTGKEYRFSRPMERPERPHYIIENKKPGYTHFTLFYKGEIWDPLNPRRAAAKEYKPSGYRLLEEM
jgi:hypothetical protein